jgi:ribonuclease J
MQKSRRKEDDNIEDTVRTAIRRAADAEWGKKPICKVIVVRV